MQAAPVATGAPNGVDHSPAPLSDQQHADAVDRIATPELDAKSVMIGPHRVALRALPIKFAKQINRILDPLAAKSEGEQTVSAALTLAGEVQEAHNHALCILGQFYGVPLNLEWIEEHLTAPEVEQILEAQMGVGKAHDFLLLSLRVTLSAVAASAALMGQIVPASPVMLPSTPASATPGTALSTSSSPDTPTDS